MLATLPVTGSSFDDLQSFLAAAQEVDDWRQIDGADWDLEIGALTEATAELIPEAPLLLFDNIKGYPAGYRVLSLSLASYKRNALALGLPLDKPKMELMRMASRMVTQAKRIPPEFVASGAVMDNVFEGAEVDVFRFPVPRFHA
ncbi:MAG TPA: UbiD family decarboxylase, partial [Chloroflexota bacterium]